MIRSNISSSPLPSQSAIKHVLKHHEQFDKEINQNINILKERYEVTKQVVYDNKYAKYWQAYDFNSGYFMSLKLNQVDPEELRKHLINNYSIGIIALNSTDIRIAFSCVEKKIFLMSLSLLLMQLMILNSLSCEFSVNSQLFHHY